MTQTEQIRQLQRERVELRRHLRDLTHAVTHAVETLDAEMVHQERAEVRRRLHKRRIEAFIKRLREADDIAKRFGLVENKQ